MFGDFYRSQGVKEVYEKGVASNLIFKVLYLEHLQGWI
jgi:hypothetical protein